MNKKAVVFAAFFPVVFRAGVYIDALKHYYPLSEYDIYIGLNTSYPGADQMLIRNGFTNIAYTPKHLEVNSDASAFQCALQLLKSSGKEYEIVHFLHTKGVSYGPTQSWMTSCNDYFIGYCKNKLIIEQKLMEGKYGGISLVGRKEPQMWGYGKELSKYCSKFPTDKVEDIMSLITFYGMLGSIVKQFLDNCDSSFFSDKLERYYFEATFPLLVDLMGYNRAYLAMWEK